MITPDRKGVFLSYRRSDTLHACGRIYDKLVLTFKQEIVFRDVESMPFGKNFGSHVESVIRECSVFVPIIGTRWLMAGENGQPRISDLEDWVRKEIEIALSDPGIKILPLLLEDANFPASSSLPPSIRPLTEFNAVKIRNDPHFHDDLDLVIHTIKQWIPESNRKEPSLMTIQKAYQRFINQRYESEMDRSGTAIIMLLEGLMDHGGPFWAYVALKPSKFTKYQKAQAEGQIDLYNFDEYGEIILAEEGEAPPGHVTAEVASVFGADLSTFFNGADPLAEIRRKMKSQKSFWARLLR